MTNADDLLTSELKKLPAKPHDTARQSDKKRYSELMSAAAARALAEALRNKGLSGTLPVWTEEAQHKAEVKVNDHADDEEGS
jgi:hypothetical protein